MDLRDEPEKEILRYRDRDLLSSWFPSLVLCVCFHIAIIPC